MTSLEGATVLVTGATGGIGRAVAERVADAGARLHVLSRSADELAPLASGSGGRAWPPTSPTTRRSGARWTRFRRRSAGPPSRW
jgi:NAD(P)-dependent dehydrogenase (short-subunit alcohol dehydrogenase family)